MTGCIGISMTSILNAQGFHTAPSGSASDFKIKVAGALGKIYSTSGLSLDSEFNINAYGGYSLSGVTVCWKWDIISSNGGHHTKDNGVLTAPYTQSNLVPVEPNTVVVSPQYPDYYHLQVVVEFDSEDTSGNTIPVTKTYNRYWHRSGLANPPQDNDQ